MAVTIGEARPLSGRASSLSAALARVALHWHRLVLGLILGLSTALEMIGLGGEGYANTYYAAGVKSMLTSWHDFFFVSYDAGGFVSLDKPPLGLWIQAASARLFGFSGVSLLLPEALAGVLSVALLYHLVARVAGSPAGLLAAAMLTATPISAIIDRNNTIDSLLILTLLLGAWAVSLGAERGRLRLLLLAATLVGLGFNIKMLQAYLVVPAFALVYLVGARLPLRTRLAHLALAAVALLIVSFCWVAAVDLTPASARPFVSDSGTNSELSLVFGYNGLGRLTQALFPGLTHLSILGDPIDLTIQPAIATGIGDPGPLRLFSPSVGGQAGWFLLPALAGLLAMLRLGRPRLPLGRQGQAALLWGAWLLAAGAFFSTARFFHLYYLVMIAPPIAALGGLGLVALWRAYRQPAESRLAAWRAWLLPATLLGTALLQVHLLDGYPDWSFWLAVIAIGGCLLAALVLAIGRLRLAFAVGPELTLQITPRAALAGLLIGVLALLAAPASWAVSGVAAGEGGAWLPQAGSATAGFGGRGGPGFGRGPNGGFAFGGQAPGFPGNGSGGNTPPGATAGGFGQGSAAPGGAPNGQTSAATGANGSGAQSGNGTGSNGQSGAGQSGAGTGRFGGGFSPNGGGGGFGFGGRGFGGGAGGAMTFAGNQVPTLDAKLLSYLKQHQGTARYLVATATSSYASLFILDTNQPVMALGGYQGWDRVLTLAQLKQEIAAGVVRFFYLPAARSSSFGQSSTFTGNGQASTARTPATGARSATSLNLDNANSALTTWVQSACTPVSTKLTQTTTSSATTQQRGFGAGGAMQLYDCAGRAGVR